MKPSKFQVWTISGKRPDWGDLPVKVAQLGSDVWSVQIEGDGSELLRLIKTKKDVFFCYQRMSA